MILDQFFLFIRFYNYNKEIYESVCSFAINASLRTFE